MMAIYIRVDIAIESKIVIVKDENSFKRDNLLYLVAFVSLEFVLDAKSIDPSRLLCRYVDSTGLMEPSERSFKSLKTERNILLLKYFNIRTPK